MSLIDLMRDTTKIRSRRSAVQKVERTKRSSSGNSADDVLINESDRMTKYISDEEKQKIVSLRSAYRHGVMKIGTKNDPAGILRNQLIPETTDRARKIASMEFFKKYHADTIKFWSKNRYARKITYMRNGKEVSYLMGLDLRTGDRIPIPKRFKKSIMEALQ